MQRGTPAGDCHRTPPGAAPAGSAGPGPRARGSLAEVAAVFLRLGVLAFGGPAAHIAMMREELVVRRRWLDERRFLDLLSVTHLIPGPNSTELAIHLGCERAGWRGLIVAGACFITPAALIVLALAHLYVTYGATPQAGWFLYGIKPVILAIVSHALWGLGRAVLRGRGLAPVVLAAIVLALYLANVHELVLLFGAGIAQAARRRAGRLREVAGGLLAVPWMARDGAAGITQGPCATVPPGTGDLGNPGWSLLGAVGPGSPAGSNSWSLAARGAGALLTGGALAAGAGGAAVPFSLGTLFLTFLKIGAVLYGSGYVLLAFLRNDFVLRLGWLTDDQLLDAVAVGQFTPGPVFTTATFVGYLTGGWPGAVVATAGIFLPSFLFVAAIRPLAGRLRRSPVTSDVLDGINVASLALMAGVTLQLARQGLVDGLTGVLFVGALVLLFRTRLNSAWLILAGAVVGLAAAAFRGTWA